MLQQNTRESALRREEFHAVLQGWLNDSFDDRAGEVDSHAGRAWLWVRHGGAHYYLDAGSTRDGVREYLRLVRDAGGDPEWMLESSPVGTRERVAVGPAGQVIDGFEFYHHVPGR